MIVEFKNIILLVKNKFLFKKLEKAENYKYWNYYMSFALQDIKLYDQIHGLAK